jgi:hypothetical protein
MTCHDPLIVSPEIVEATRSTRSEAEARAERSERRQCDLRRQRAIGRAEGISDSLLHEGEHSLRLAHRTADTVEALHELFLAAGRS